MAGGIVQYLNTGSEDVFLTGNPQITFFKFVYRRHTNFATEIIKQNFSSGLDFGGNCNCTVEKIGDLMGKVYLQIDIPEIALKKTGSDTKSVETVAAEKKIFEHLFNLVNRYIEQNVNLAKNILSMVSINNVYLNDITDLINNKNFISELNITQQQLYEYINQTESILEKFMNVNNFKDSIKMCNILSNIKYIIKTKSKNNVNNTGKLDATFIRLLIKQFIMRDYYDLIYNLNNDVLQQLTNLNTSYSNSTSENYKSAWVEQLGNAIVDNISFTIGNQTIDKHTGDWLILYNQLYDSVEKSDIYNEMIGNVDQLTNFNSSIKKHRKLTVPLRFSFCCHTGLALPLISLKYHEVNFDLKLKHLRYLFYVEKDMIGENIEDIDDIIQKYNIHIDDANLLVEYIFLENNERTRFASCSHEYLIETVQHAVFNNCTTGQFQQPLNFSNPIKFLVWFAQPSYFRENRDGTNKCQWNNFSISDDKKENPVQTAGIKINNYDRISTHLGGSYYNYVQPYWHFNNTPGDGLNVYSFALHPTMLQPSSALNASRIDELKLVINFKKKFIDSIFPNKSESVEKIEDENSTIPTIIVSVYAVNYNIFRIFYGMGGLAFPNNTD